MAGYAIAFLQNLTVNRQVVAYLNRIDATLEPFDGHFLVHGKRGTVVEGETPGQAIVIEFPSLQHARDWYHSKAYQAIVELRTANSVGSVILVDGVPTGYKATDLLG